MAGGLYVYGPTSYLTEVNDRDSRSDLIQPNPKDTLTQQTETRSQPATSNLTVKDRMEALETLPASLQGLPRPELPEINGQGELLPDYRLRQLFDFYLSAKGEEELDRINERIELELYILPEPARSQAMTVLGQYLALKKSESDMKRLNMDNSVEGMMALKRQIIDQRRMFLSPDMAAAFYRDEEAIDNYNLALMELTLDTELNDIEKGNRRIELLAELPQHLQDSRRWEQSLNAFRAHPSTIDAGEVFDNEAIERFDSLGAERALWAARVQKYEMERDTALAFVDDLTGPQAQAIIAEVRARHFEGPELTHIAALDKIASDR